MFVYERQVKEDREQEWRDIKDIKETYREREERKVEMKGKEKEEKAWWACAGDSGGLPGTKSCPGMGMMQRESAKFIRLSHFYPPQHRLSYTLLVCLRPGMRTLQWRGSDWQSLSRDSFTDEHKMKPRDQLVSHPLLPRRFVQRGNATHGRKVQLYCLSWGRGEIETLCARGHCCPHLNLVRCLMGMMEEWVLFGRKRWKSSKR